MAIAHPISTSSKSPGIGRPVTSRNTTLTTVSTMIAIRTAPPPNAAPRHKMRTVLLRDSSGGMSRAASGRFTIAL